MPSRQERTEALPPDVREGVKENPDAEKGALRSARPQVGRTDTYEERSSAQARDKHAHLTDDMDPEERERVMKAQGHVSEVHDPTSKHDGYVAPGSLDEE